MGKEILTLCLGNIEILREYAEEALAIHLRDFGEDRPRYKREADVIREDIAAAKDLEKMLRSICGIK